MGNIGGFSLIATNSNVINLDNRCVLYSISYSAFGGTRTRSICVFEYEYHFIEYEYDNSEDLSGVRREVSNIVAFTLGN